VIVPVRDDPQGVRALVEALACQTLPRDRYEVVIADDGSRAPVQVPDVDADVRVVAGPPQNSYVARNRAASAARGRVLAFCDSDCAPEPKWLEAGLRALKHVELVAGLVNLRGPEPPTVWTLLDVELFLDQERSVARGGAATANLFVTRDLFDRIGGFDVSLPSGGDFDFVRRAVADGAHLELAPEAVVWHPTRDSAAALFSKLWRVTKSHARRRSGDGRLLPPITPLVLVPAVGPVIGRRRSERPLGLDSQRLRQCGIAPLRRTSVLALLVLYGVVPYVGVIAETAVWWERRRRPRC
jgi:glycosyltransferase involved in cell wall biosynthesis